MHFSCTWIETRGRPVSVQHCTTELSQPSQLPTTIDHTHMYIYIYMMHTYYICICFWLFLCIYIYMCVCVCVRVRFIPQIQDNIYELLSQKPWFTYSVALQDGLRSSNLFIVWGSVMVDAEWTARSVRIRSFGWWMASASRDRYSSWRTSSAGRSSTSWRRQQLAQRHQGWCHMMPVLDSIGSQKLWDDDKLVDN